MPPSWRENVKSQISIDLKKRICVLAIIMYDGANFEFCNKHLFYLSERLQLLAHKSAILNICLKQLWADQSINKTFCQFISNNCK